MVAYVRPWIAALVASLRLRSDLVFENAALRHQLAMYERRRPDIRDAARDIVKSCGSVRPADHAAAS